MNIHEQVVAGVSALALAVGSWTASEVIDHKVKLAVVQSELTAIHAAVIEVGTDVKTLRATQLVIQQQVAPIRR